MEYPEDNFDRNRMLNLLAFLTESLSLNAQFVVRKCNFMLRSFMEKFEIIELLDAISDKLAEHPPLRFLVFVCVISCIIPIVMFVLFGIATVVITFAGFLFIEGTLLAVGGICMFLCITSMILVLTVMAVTSGGLYLLFLKLGQVLNKFEATSNIMRSLAPAVVDNQNTQISNLNAHLHQH